MQRVITLFLKTSLIVMGLIVFGFGTIGLPQLAEKAATLYPEYSHLQYPVLIGIGVTAVPFFIAFYQAFMLLKLIENEAAFSGSAIRRLHTIKYCALSIVIMYVIGSLFLVIQHALHPGVAIIGFAIIFASLIIAVFAMVLQHLFEHAKELKTENDLTV